MKRSKVLAVLFAVGFMAVSATGAFALTVEEEIAELKSAVAALKKVDVASSLGITIEAGGTFVLQGVSKANDGTDKGITDASFSFDLGLGKEFDNGGMLFAHIEGAHGDGLCETSIEAYSSVNADAGSTDNLLEITEFWYEQPLFDKKVTVTFGKLNAGGYFDENAAANDETEQFLASMFVNNTAIALPDNNVGLRVTYSPVEFLDITYAYINQNDDLNRVNTNGFNAVQATLKYSDKGNYRVMYWGSNIDEVSFKTGEEASGYGIALSLDHQIAEDIILFGRYGYQNPEVYELSSAWSFGAQFGGGIWSRDNDVVGIAVGQNIVSKDYVDSVGGGYSDDIETQAEAYYKLGINDNVAFTPVLQYVVKPMGGNAADDNDVVTFGIRMQVSF